MRAIQVAIPGGPEVLELVERPFPQPGTNEVRVRATAIGVSGADLLVRMGTYKWMPSLPAIPGNEMAGVIDGVGEGVTGLREGQRVLVSSRELPFRGGCYAEAICVPAEAVFVLPENISPYDAVTLPNYQLAGALLYESGMKKPRRVAIYGAAGGVGIALLQLALADGIDAIGIVSTEQKREFARSAGASKVVLRDSPTLVEEVMALTNGSGVDVAYAMAGQSFIHNLDLLAPLGTLVSFSRLGGGARDADIFAELRRRSGRGLAIRAYSIHVLDREPETRRGLMKRAMDLMVAGRLLPPAPTLLPLRDARRAHQLLEENKALGKLVLTPD